MENNIERFQVFSETREIKSIQVYDVQEGQFSVWYERTLTNLVKFGTPEDFLIYPSKIEARMSLLKILRHNLLLKLEEVEHLKSELNTLEKECKNEDILI